MKYFFYHRERKNKIINNGTQVEQINTFASQPFVFEKKTFPLENASYFTHVFLYDIFYKKI